MIKAILWDNDGLLVDSERLYYEANRQALLRAGIRLTKEQFTEVSLRQGLSLIDLARQKGWTGRQIAELRKERDALYLSLLQSGARLFPGVARTLKGLKALGIRMAVVTSSQRIHFDAIHAQFKLLSYFEFTLTREEFVRGKPAPDGYREGLRRLNVPAAECLAVEDSARGLQSARAAGLACVVVPNQLSSAGDFSDALAVLPRVSEILRWIRGTPSAPTPHGPKTI